eukprot:5584314-Pyramimonas_sp.AAC.1
MPPVIPLISPLDAPFQGAHGGHAICEGAVGGADADVVCGGGVRGDQICGAPLSAAAVLPQPHQRGALPVGSGGHLPHAGALQRAPRP